MHHEKSIHMICVNKEVINMPNEMTVPSTCYE